MNRTETSRAVRRGCPAQGTALGQLKGDLTPVRTGKGHRPGALGVKSDGTDMQRLKGRSNNIPTSHHKSHHYARQDSEPQSSLLLEY